MKYLSLCKYIVNSDNNQTKENQTITIHKGKMTFDPKT